MSHLAYYDQSNRNPVVPHCFSDLPAAVDVAADVAAVDVAADDAVVVAAAAGRVDWNTSVAVFWLIARHNRAPIDPPSLLLPHAYCR